LMVFFFLRVKHLKHKIFAVIIILFILFFYTTAATLIREHDIDFTSFDGIVSATKIYFSWLVSMFSNLKDVTSNVIKMDWTGNLTDG